MPTRLALLLLATLVTPGAYAQSAQATTDATIEAQAKIDDAIPIVEKMKADPQVNELLRKARGVVIVPHYLQAALVFGGRGGSGSDTKGLFGGAAVGANKVSRDVAANQIYYNNHDVTAQQILSGAATNPKARRLVDVLP